MFSASRFCTAIAFALSVLCASPAQARQAPQAPSAQEQAASKLLSASDWAAALTAYRALVAAEPSNPRAVFGLAGPSTVAKGVRGEVAHRLRGIRRERALASDTPRKQSRRRVKGANLGRPSGSPRAEEYLCEGQSDHAPALFLRRQLMSDGVSPLAHLSIGPLVHWSIGPLAH